MNKIMLDDQQLLRYSRHIMLPQFDIAGQQRVSAARVLVVGMGGLGAPVVMYLAAAGVGRLVLADNDRVELTNLQRQIIYTSDDLGRLKVEAAAARVQSMNPQIGVTRIAQRLEGSLLVQQVAEVDLVIDATDNFATRFALNDACVRAHKPLVSGAAIRLEAQIAVFPNDGSDAPCYRCLYKDENEIAEACSQSGILGPVVGVIGSLQALEALKMLAGMGSSLVGRVMLFDAQHLEWRTLKLRRDPACPTCSPRVTQLAVSP